MRKVATPQSIGIFDSGIGGESFAIATRRAFPKRDVITVNDREHLPYGDKSPEQLLLYVVPKLQQLVDQGCEAIVIACNTVTTTLITELRRRIPVPLIGIEPMIKPAASVTQSGVIAVCATPTTLASQRYQWLKRTYAADIQVIEPDCSRWAYMIEHDTIDRQHIRDTVQSVCAAGADVIVLGCTHYHWIEETIVADANAKAAVIQPEQAVIKQLKRVLARSA